MTNKRPIRVDGFFMIFQSEFGHNLPELLEEYLNEEQREPFYKVRSLTDNDVEYIVRMVEMVDGNREKIVGYANKHTIEWDFKRLGSVCRTLLQLAICEMLFFDDIDARVSINEAIEISKTYDSKQATDYLNAVLDKISKELG